MGEPDQQLRMALREMALCRAMGLGLNDHAKVLAAARIFESYLLGDDPGPRGEKAPDYGAMGGAVTPAAPDPSKPILRQVGFPRVLEAVQNGYRARRAGWNGKGMFVFLHLGSAPRYTSGTGIEGVPMRLFEKGDAGTAVRLPSLALHTASGSTVIGWLASQTDMLAADWEVLAECA